MAKAIVKTVWMNLIVQRQIVQKMNSNVRMVAVLQTTYDAMAGRIVRTDRMNMDVVSVKFLIYLNFHTTYEIVLFSKEINLLGNFKSVKRTPRNYINST